MLETYLHYGVAGPSKSQCVQLAGAVFGFHYLIDIEVILKEIQTEKDLDLVRARR